jgi:hypothetical protein
MHARHWRDYGSSKGVTNVYDNELADSRYEEINTRFRREIESVWQELKKKC